MEIQIKNPPPRVGENFSLPLSFCPRLSRAGFAFMEFSIYFRWRLRAKCCSKLWGWPASNRNTLLKLHTAPCVSLVKKKKKNLPSIFIISLVLVPILPPLFQRLLCTKAHSLSLSLSLSFPPSLSVSVSSLCLRFVFLLKIERGSLRRCVRNVSIKRRWRFSPRFPFHGITIARLIYPYADQPLFAN